MSRSIRRHQIAVAKQRKLRILRWHWRHPERTWRQIGNLIMNEPGTWVREMMTRPARHRSRHFEHLVVRGLEDHWRWPDNRKPHKYYW